MAYLVLARKYRPALFDEIIGQEHITGVLKNSISANRLAHAFLFCGPRGIGKTSCARILAKTLNCQSAPTLTPCGVCSACKEISQGNSFDVLEIDGASNRGIDEIRTLRENVKFSPGYGKYKIYIIDEVHMLTTEAFNALLKTLEEPPEHVKFIFATTDPNKVPGTIISRCQRYDFKRIPVKLCVESLDKICTAEGFHVEQDALYAVAKAAQGSFRDALSILDQVSAVSASEIKGEDVYSMLGLVELDLLFALSEALAEHNCTAALKIFDDIIDKGKDLRQLGKDLVEHFRNLMIINVGGKALGKLVDYPTAIKELYLAQSQKMNLSFILEAIDAFIRAQEVSRITESLRTPLEIAFARLTFSKDEAAKKESPNSGDVPRIAPVAPVARPAAPLKPSSVSPASFSRTVPKEGILGNKKGEVAIAPKPVSVAKSASDELRVEKPAGDELLEEPMAEVDVDVAPEALTLEKIRKVWDALTFGVSREKMSLATYLQEGAPIAFDGHRLRIGFSKDHEFHKETLEHKENTRLVEGIFSEKLKAPILLEFTISDAGSISQAVPDEPMVKSALSTFGGKVVSQWHKG